jgi:hypothetical protein
LNGRERSGFVFSRLLQRDGPQVLPLDTGMDVKVRGIFQMQKLICACNIIRRAAGRHPKNAGFHTGFILDDGVLAVTYAEECSAYRTETAGQYCILTAETNMVAR